MKIKSLRELALALNAGPTALSGVSKQLHARIDDWARRGHVVVADGVVSLTKGGA
jgi:hypothetical protein